MEPDTDDEGLMTEELEAEAVSEVAADVIKELAVAFTRVARTSVEVLEILGDVL